MPKRKLSGSLTHNEQIDLMTQAMSGDLVMVIEPETVELEATAEAWTRDVTITIETADGDVHEWLTADYATTLSIDDDSTAGTASIESTTLSIVNGKAVVTVSGDAEDWIADETDTLTVGEITVLGSTVTGGTSVQTIVAGE